MKVCLLNDSFPPVLDGVANAVTNYALQLSAMSGTKVTVGTPEYPGQDYSAFPFPVVTWPSFDTTKLTGGYRAGYPFSLKVMRELAGFRPNIIHTHCPISSCLMARFLRAATDAPIVFTYHTKYDIEITNTIPAPLRESTKRAMVENISACDEVWAVSRGAGENLRTLGYEGAYKVVPNGVDFVRGAADDAAVELATAGWDLPADVPVFLYVGRLVNYKNIPMILDALGSLRNHHDFRMVMIGKGADEQSIRTRAQALGIPIDEKLSDGTIRSSGNASHGKLLLTGPVYDRETLRAWNTRADLFVFPSTFDTNGLVVREAAACGLASVLVKGSCAGEDVSDGRNGYLIEENAEALGAVLVWACEHRDEVRAVGNQAMMDLYLSWHDAVSHARSLYDDLLERRATGLFSSKIDTDDEKMLFEFTGSFISLSNQLSAAKDARLKQADNPLSRFISESHEIVDDLKSFLRKPE